MAGKKHYLYTLLFHKPAIKNIFYLGYQQLHITSDYKEVFPQEQNNSSEKTEL